MTERESDTTTTTTTTRVVNGRVYRVVELPPALPKSNRPHGVARIHGYAGLARWCAVHDYDGA